MSDPEVAYEWAPPPPAEPGPIAGTALWLAIAGLGVSLFVGWGFPLALGALILAAVALRRPRDRRPRDRRGAAWWAVGLAVASLVYSAGWLLWAFSRL